MANFPLPRNFGEKQKRADICQVSQVALKGLSPEIIFVLNGAARHTVDNT